MCMVYLTFLVIHCRCSRSFIIAAFLHIFYFFNFILLLYYLRVLIIYPAIRHFLWRCNCPTAHVLGRGKCPPIPFQGRANVRLLLSMEGLGRGKRFGPKCQGGKCPFPRLRCALLSQSKERQ